MAAMSCTVQMTGSLCHESGFGVALLLSYMQISLWRKGTLDNDRTLIDLISSLPSRMQLLPCWCPCKENDLHSLTVSFKNHIYIYQ